MKVKLVLGGEAVNIPHTSIGMGVTFVKVWLDGKGFTSASNDLGALGYILLETPTVDIGTLDDERQRLFTHLHGSVVQFKIKPNIFAKDGGIARISLTVGVQDGGSVNEKSISFTADNCTGVSLVSNEISFSAEMLMMDDRVAANDKFIPDNDVTAAVNAAPKDQDQNQAVASNDSHSGQGDGQDQRASQSQDQGQTASQDQGQTASNDGSTGDQDQSSGTSQSDSQDQTVASQDSGSGSSDEQGQSDDQQDAGASQTDDSQVPA